MENGGQVALRVQGWGQRGGEQKGGGQGTGGGDQVGLGCGLVGGGEKQG